MCSQGKATLGEAQNASFRQARRSRRAVRTSRNCTRENRETWLASGGWKRRIGPGSQKRNPDMHASQESSRCIVPAKRPNKAEMKTAAEGVEGRRRAKEIPGTGPVLDAVPE